MRGVGLRQRPRIGLVLAGAVAVERESSRRWAVGEAAWCSLPVSVSRPGKEGVEGHGGCLSAGVAAPIAAFTGDPWPEAETAGTRRPPLCGWQGPERSGGWRPGGYFASRCKAGHAGPAAANGAPGGMENSRAGPLQAGAVRQIARSGRPLARRFFRRERRPKPTRDPSVPGRHQRRRGSAVRDRRNRRTSTNRSPVGRGELVAQSDGGAPCAEPPQVDVEVGEGGDEIADLDAEEVPRACRRSAAMRPAASLSRAT